MALREITVDPPMISGDVKELESLIESTRTHFNNMDANLEALNGMWSGSARDAFVAHYEADKEAFRDLFETIDSLIDSMKYAAREYSVCELQIEEMVSSIGE